MQEPFKLIDLLARMQFAQFPEMRMAVFGKNL